MKKIIFIDRGNVLRSPMAKAIFNSLKTEGSLAFSYGTNVEKQGKGGLKLSDHPGMNDLFLVLSSHRLDISDEHCTQLVPEHLIDADRIIVMTEKEDIPEWLNGYNYEYWEVPNPAPVTKDVAEDLYVLLKNKILELNNL